jgi:hypothetical protein
MMTSQLHPKKLRSVAELARFCVSKPDLLADSLLQQVLGIAIRKLHDHSQSVLGRGKYLGHAYWSEAARELLAQNGGKLRGIQNHLAHEHVVPLQLIVEQLLRLPASSGVADFEAIISRLSLVAILKKGEEVELDNRLRALPLPPDWHEKDLWARYRSGKFLHCIFDGDGRCVDAGREAQTEGPGQ